MKILKTLKDCNIFKIPEYKEPETYEDRQTVKTIVFNENNEIALVTNPVHKIFLLPGGGAESEDLEKEAKRESLEEINYYINILDKVGMVEEFRNRDSKHYLTTCFTAKVVTENNEDLRTKEEQEKGLEVAWFSLNDAIKIMTEQVERVEKGEIGFYNTAFNIVRDFNFLELLKNKL